MKINHVKALFLALLLSVFSCSDDNVPETTVSDAQMIDFSIENLGLTKNVIQIENIPAIQDALTKKSNSKVFTKNSDTKGVWVDLEHITEMIVSTNAKNYSFALRPEGQEENTFFNLIVPVDDSGRIGEPYVLAFKSANKTAINEGELEMFSFSSFFPNGLENKGLCEPEFEPNGDPIPCDNAVIGQSGSGGASTGPSSISGAGPSSSGGGQFNSGPCSIISYSVKCNGPNRDSAHSPQECGDASSGYSGSYVAFDIDCGGATNKAYSKVPIAKAALPALLAQSV